MSYSAKAAGQMRSIYNEMKTATLTSERVVKGVFVTRHGWALFFPVKCEMVYFFLVNRDFHSSREA